MVKIVCFYYVTFITIKHTHTHTHTHTLKKDFLMAVLGTKITKIDQDVVSALRVLVLDHVCAHSVTSDSLRPHGL